MLTFIKSIGIFKYTCAYLIKIYCLKIEIPKLLYHHPFETSFYQINIVYIPLLSFLSMHLI